MSSQWQIPSVLHLTCNSDHLLIADVLPLEQAVAHAVAMTIPPRMQPRGVQTHTTPLGPRVKSGARHRCVCCDPPQQRYNHSGTTFASSLS